MSISSYAQFTLGCSLSLSLSLSLSQPSNKKLKRLLKNRLLIYLILSVIEPAAIYVPHA